MRDIQGERERDTEREREKERERERERDKDSEYSFVCGTLGSIPGSSSLSHSHTFNTVEKGLLVEVRYDTPPFHLLIFEYFRLRAISYLSTMRLSPNFLFPPI